MDAKCYILVLILSLHSVIVTFCDDSVDDIVLDTAVQRKAPGLKAPKKLWWAKEITPDYHVAGRLSERQIKYAADGGFKSIVSLFHYDEPLLYGGGEYLPSSKEEEEIVKSAGMQFYKVGLTGLHDKWASVETVEHISRILPTLEKPILLHCNRGYTISFVTLMHMANRTRHDPSFTPKISSGNFYNITAAMGIDFTMENTKQVVAEITGEEVVKNPPRLNAEPELWKIYWKAHPVYKNWFTAGQIRDTDLKVLEEVGFKAVVNMRQGVETDGKPSQEQVTLINIKDGTPTYGDENSLPRQVPEQLERLILDPSKSKGYGSENLNYETSNPGEFGDEIGYNEDLEKEAFEKSTLKYYHIPIDSNGKYSPELFGKYKDMLLEAGRNGPVLVHCASAKRVAYMSVLASAVQYNKDFNWALKRIRELGFYVSPTKQPDVYEMFAAWLKKDRSNETGHLEL